MMKINKIVLCILIISIILSGCTQKQDIVPEVSNAISATDNGEIDENQSNKVISILAGEDYSAALFKDGSIFFWGNNKFGIENLGVEDNIKTPTLMKKIPDAVKVTGGWSHLLVLDNNGDLWGVGTNGNGQLGDGTFESKDTIFKLDKVNNIIDIDSQGDSVIALKDNGKVWTWGDNMYGQLGTSRENIEMPECVNGLNDFKQVATGGLYSLALKNDGNVYAWGYFSEINLCTDNFAAEPSKVIGISEIKSISGSPSSALALKEDGTVWYWGDVDKVQQVEGLKNIVSIEKGHFHNVAIDNQGKVWTWGNNEYGELGYGFAEKDYFAPRQIEGLKDIIAVSGGDGHTIALDSNGDVWTWGKNDKGQLGDNTDTDKYEPTKIEFNANSQVLSSKDK